MAQKRCFIWPSIRASALFGPHFRQNTIKTNELYARPRNISSWLRLWLHISAVVVHCLYQISVETGLVAAQRREVRTSKVYEPSSGAVLAAISNGLRVYFLVNHMTNIELSLHLEANYPANKTSITMRKPRYGVGVNDAHYATQPIVNGVKLRDPAYSAWVDMIRRAYSQKYHASQPTYIGVTVCKEWHSFSAFRVWWLANYRDGFQCDKDLLVVGNREYRPEACVYIPSWLNKFTIDHGASRGELPIGVCLHKPTGRYYSQCSSPFTGKQYYLGLFTTPEAAHEAWLKRKLELADQLRPQMDVIDPRIHPNVVTIIKAAE